MVIIDCLLVISVRDAVVVDGSTRPIKVYLIHAPSRNPVHLSWPDIFNGEIASLHGHVGWSPVYQVIYLRIQVHAGLEHVVERIRDLPITQRIDINHRGRPIGGTAPGVTARAIDLAPSSDDRVQVYLDGADLRLVRLAASKIRHDETDGELPDTL